MRTLPVEACANLCRYRLFVVIAACFQASVIFLFGLTRLYSFKTSINDLGIFRGIMEQILQGHLPFNSIQPPYSPQFWFGFHFSPILYLWAPFYWLWPHPETLIVLQAILMALAAPMIFSIGLALGLKARDAAFFAVLALINPYLFNAGLFDVHEIAFAVPLMCLALWGLIAGRFSWLLIASAGLMLTKEHYGLSVAAFGLLWGWMRDDWKRGGLLCALGIAGLALILGCLMPMMNEAHTHPMFTNDGTTLSRYGWIKPNLESAGNFLRIIFTTKPQNFPGALYLILMFASTGFLSAGTLPLLAAGAADLIANLFSSNSMPRLHIAYHSAPLVPVFIVAGMMTWQRIIVPLRLALGWIAAFVSISMLIVTGGVWYWEIHSIQPHLSSSDQASLKIFEEQLTSCEHPAVQADIGALQQVPATETPFPAAIEQADCAALHLAYPYKDSKKNLLSSPYEPLLNEAAYIAFMSRFMKDDNWHVAYWNDPWLFMRRGTASEQPGVRKSAGERLRTLSLNPPATGAP